MVEQVTKDSLLPCPHCGATSDGSVRVGTAGEDHEECCELQAGQVESFAVCCDFNAGGCGAGGGYRLSRDEAIEAWNNRESRS